MKVLVVYAHPNPQSFNHAILEAFTAGLAEAQHEYEIVDLYAVNFNPCLSGKDLSNLFERTPADDIRAQQEKVSSSDAVVFIYPVWWTGPPAILKGWIDRVLSMGFAYGFDEKDGHPVGLLKNRKALVLNTAGSAAEEASMSGSADALKKIQDDLTLRFCGINDVGHVIFHNIIMADETVRQRYLEEARDLGRKF